MWQHYAVALMEMMQLESAQCCMHNTSHYSKATSNVLSALALFRTGLILSKQSRDSVFFWGLFGTVSEIEILSWR